MLKKYLLILIPLITIVCGLPSVALADDIKDTVYGWELMSEQERIEHRNTIRALKTRQEREAYRAEHHEKMKQRAEEMGVQLPEKPMPMGRGMRGWDDNDEEDDQGDRSRDRDGRGRD